jgi:hypothetical protein
MFNGGTVVAALAEERAAGRDELQLAFQMLED